MILGRLGHHARLLAILLAEKGKQLTTPA